MEKHSERDASMTDIAFAPGVVIAETLDTLRSGATPATVGAIGAAAGLLGLPFVFTVASLPMSLLGIGLGVRSRNSAAVLLGGAGIVLAAYGLAVA